MKKKNLDLYKNKFKSVELENTARFLQYLDGVKKTDKFMKDLEERMNYIYNLKSNILTMIFYIIPEATPRPRMSLRNGKFYVKNAKSNNEFVRLLVEKEKDLLHIIHTPCKFFCDVYFPIPNDMSVIDTILSEKRLIKHIKTPDWDNIGKTYSDMVQKYILLNDSLIYEGTVRKFYSLKPRVEITIEYLLDYDCKYNKKVVEKSKFYNELYDGGGL